MQQVQSERTNVEMAPSGRGERIELALWYALTVIATATVLGAPLMVAVAATMTRLRHRTRLSRGLLVALGVALTLLQLGVNAWPVDETTVGPVTGGLTQ